MPQRIVFEGLLSLMPAMNVQEGALVKGKNAGKMTQLSDHLSDFYNITIRSMGENLD